MPEQECLDINLFRWKTIWTSILGYRMSELPALFLFQHFTQLRYWKNFLTAHAITK
jgi:hypothetical protein